MTENNYSTIRIKFMGGIGNRLFQLASVMALAGRTNRVFVFDKKYMDLNSHTKTDVFFQKILSKLPEQSDENREFEKHQIVSWDERVKNARFDDFLNHLLCNYRNVNHIMLDGLFISAAFAEGMDSKSQTLLACLLNDSFDNAIFEKIGPDSVQLFNAVALHVRRGDYLDHANRWLHVDHFQSGYYLNAMAQFDNTYWFLVFSDDIDWCIQNKEKFGCDRHIIFVPAEVGPLESIALMGKCVGGCITSNSTFSWWGAWLSNQNNPSTSKIVMPSKWYSMLPWSGITHTLEVQPTFANVL